MTLDEMKALISANKQSMQLIDKRMTELKKLVDHDEFNYWEEGRYPYYYGVVGIDGEPGIIIGDGEDGEAPVSRVTPTTLEQNENRVWNGHIQIQSDAPFVATHVHACLKKDIGDVTAITGNASVGTPSFRGVMGGGPDPFGPDYFFPDISLGFSEASSGRILFQSDQVDRDVNGTQDKLLTTELFNTVRLFRPSPTNGIAAMGNGPEEGFELPAETLLPLNDVINVQARATFFQNVTPSIANTNGPIRVYVTLLGYKIFGD